MVRECECSRAQDTKKASTMEVHRARDFAAYLESEKSIQILPEIVQE